MKPEIGVVAGLIRQGNKILISQRVAGDTFGLLWEFPGGKVEGEELLEEALKRELKEELGIDVEVKRLIHTFSDENEKLKINVHLFEGEIRRGEPQPLECNACAFVSLEEIEKFNLAPVDRKIIRFLLAEERLKIK